MTKYLYLSLITFFSCFPSHAEFGPWPHRYFVEGGLLSCEKAEKCRVPQMGDIQALKEDWERSEGERIAHLEYLKSEARALLDLALGTAQEEVNRYEASIYGRIMMEEVTRSSETLKPLLDGDLDLWVSNSSPVYQLFIELETKLNQDTNFDRASYQEWLKKENTQLVLKNIGFVERDYFSQKESSLLLKVLYVEIPLLKAFNLKNCPPAVEKELGDFLGTSTFFKDPKGKKKALLSDKEFFSKLFLSSQQDQEIQVHCDEKKVFPKPRIKEESSRRFELKYKLKGSGVEIPKAEELKVLLP